MRRVSKQKHSGRYKRSKRGYALVASLTISTFGMMLLLAMAQVASSLANSELVQLAKSRSQRTAELATSYVVSQFQKLDDNSLLPPDNADTAMFTLPTNLFPDSTIRVRVTRLSNQDLATLRTNDFDAEPPPPDQSPKQNLLYNESWDPNQNSTDRFTPKPDKSYFFVVHVTAYQGGFASSVQVTLSPDIVSVPRDDTPTPRPSGLMANGNISLGSQLGYLDVLAPGDGFSSAQTTPQGTHYAFKSAVQSNTSVDMKPATTIYGDVIVNNPASAGTVAQSASSMIFGRLQTNTVDNGSATQGFKWTNNAALPDGSDNVWALADAFASNFSTMARQGLNYSQAGGADSQNSRIEASPVPTPTNTAGLTMPSATGQDDVSINAGSYSATSFDTTQSTANLLFNEDGGTTQIFIDPATTDEIVIDSTKITNMGESSDLQIFYAGNKPINIVLTGSLAGNPEMKAMIYAPNSTVNTTGFGEFYGAILAKEANINHVGDLRLDPTASSVIANYTNVGLTSTGGGDPNAPVVMKPQVYRIRTWQAVPGALVPVGS